MQVLVVNNGSTSVKLAEVTFDKAPPHILAQPQWLIRGRDPGAFIGEFLLVGSEDPATQAAVQLDCYHLRKYLGAFMAALSGVDGIVFGGEALLPARGSRVGVSVRPSDETERLAREASSPMQLSQGPSDAR